MIARTLAARQDTRVPPVADGARARGRRRRGCQPARPGGTVRTVQPGVRVRGGSPGDIQRARVRRPERPGGTRAVRRLRRLRAGRGDVPAGAAAARRTGAGGRSVADQQDPVCGARPDLWFARGLLPRGHRAAERPWCAPCAGRRAAQLLGPEPGARLSRVRTPGPHGRGSSRPGAAGRNDRRYGRGRPGHGADRPDRTRPPAGARLRLRAGDVHAGRHRADGAGLRAPPPHRPGARRAGFRRIPGPRATASSGIRGLGRPGRHPGAGPGPGHVAGRPRTWFLRPAPQQHERTGTGARRPADHGGGAARRAAERRVRAGRRRTAGVPGRGGPGRRRVPTPVR